MGSLSHALTLTFPSPLSLMQSCPVRWFRPPPPLLLCTDPLVSSCIFVAYCALAHLSPILSFAAIPLFLPLLSRTAHPSFYPTLIAAQAEYLDESHIPFLWLRRCLHCFLLRLAVMLTPCFGVPPPSCLLWLRRAACPFLTPLAYAHFCLRKFDSAMSYRSNMSHLAAFLFG